MGGIELMFQISLNNDLSLRLASPTDTIAIYQLIDENRDYLSKYLPGVQYATFDIIKSFLTKAHNSFISGTMFEYAV